MIYCLPVVLFFLSCEKENKNDTRFDKGVLVTNEGLFNASNGSVSHIDPVTGKVTNHVFLTVNERPPGDIVQSMAVFEGRGFIVVNNSHKVEVVDTESFKSLHTITGVDYPRYFLGIDRNKGYLTDGNFGGLVRVIDLESMEIIDNIPVGYGPEALVRSGQHVFVANSGGWGSDSTVSVIDIATNTVVETVHAGDRPTDMDVDVYGNVWVLCHGNLVYDMDWNIVDESPSMLVKIDPLSFETTAFEIGTAGDGFNPQRLAISADLMTLYFEEAGGVYAMPVGSPSVPAEPLITGSLYGLDVDPATGEIYVLEANGFETNGTARKYLPDGTPAGSFEVGLFPNGAVFPGK